MKKAMQLFCLVISLLLGGCGGGSNVAGGSEATGGSDLAGGSEEVSGSYKGKTTQAALTVDSSKRFFRFLFTGVLNEPPSTGNTPVAKIAAVGRRTAKTALSTSKNLAAALPVEGTINGTESGSAKYTGYLEENGTGSMTISYTAFSPGDGYSYNGVMQITINDVEPFSKNILEARFNFDALTVTSKDEQLSMEGDILLQIDPASKTETLLHNINGRMTSGPETFRLKDLKAVTIYDNLDTPTSSTETLIGRLYLGNEGYVEISQTTPLQFDYLGRSTVDVPNAGGPILLNGAAAGQARITPISISQLKIDVDSDGDGLFESSVTELWSEYTGKVYSW